MDRTSALAFLMRHQPLPSDEDLKEELIEEYEAVRKYFIEHPDPACIPLFLNSFGGNAASDIYMMVVREALWPYSLEQVLPHLLQSLRSPYRFFRTCFRAYAAHTVASAIGRQRWPLVSLRQF